MSTFDGAAGFSRGFSSAFLSFSSCLSVSMAGFSASLRAASGDFTSARSGTTTSSVGLA